MEVFWAVATAVVTFLGVGVALGILIQNQGKRVDVSIHNLEKRMDASIRNQGKRLDRLEDRLGGVETGLATIQGLIEGWKTAPHAVAPYDKHAPETGG